jgi:hypothetical protein
MEVVSSTPLTKETFLAYIKDKYFGSLPATKIILHHTWKPTVADWKGQSTFLGIKKYYEGKLWGKGPHIFVAPDGIWLMTDIQKDGYHAGITGNWRSIGIEVVGDYDHVKWENPIKELALFVIDSLQKKLKIADTDIKFHRDYSTKSCPGNAITKEWLMQELQRYRGDLYSDVPDWKNVVGGQSAKNIWLQAKEKQIFSVTSKFTDPINKGELAIILKRLNIF